MSRKTLTKRLRFEILKRDRFTCRYCGKSCHETDLHVDHVIPVSSGGDNSYRNLKTACSRCNLGKSDTDLTDRIPFKADVFDAERVHDARNRLDDVLRNHHDISAIDAAMGLLLAELWERFLDGILLGPEPIASMGALSSRYSMNQIINAMNIASEYLEFDSHGTATFDSTKYATEMIEIILEESHGQQSEERFSGRWNT